MMNHPRSLSPLLFAARVLAAAGAVAVTSVQATPFELVYTGVFNTQPSSPEALNPATAPAPIPFTGPTPFTVQARFDDRSPNLAPAFGGPFTGFRAYAPSAVSIDINGVRYRVETITDNPTAGVTVALFDQFSFDPGHYGIGLIANPVTDGAGIVGDFLSAAPDFTVDALTPTVFTDYYGVGHSSGVCLSGTPPDCPHAITPWVLYDANNVAWSLTLGNYEEDYPAAHTPGAPVGPLNTARLLAVPEPATLALLLAGMTGLNWTVRRRRAPADAGTTAGTSTGPAPAA